MYELIITEKPAAAKKIAEALADNKPKKETYMRKIPYYRLTHNKKEIIVACAVGHLYGLAEKDKQTIDEYAADCELKPGESLMSYAIPVTEEGRLVFRYVYE